MSAPDSISTLVEDHDGVSVVSVTGEIDLVTAPALEQALGTVIADDPTALVIDLSAVEFLGSVGLKILAATYEKLDKSDRVRRRRTRSGDPQADQPDRSGQDLPAVPDARRRVDRGAGRLARPHQREVSPEAHQALGAPKKRCEVCGVDQDDVAGTFFGGRHPDECI